MLFGFLENVFTISFDLCQRVFISWFLSVTLFCVAHLLGLLALCAPEVVEVQVGGRGCANTSPFMFLIGPRISFGQRNGASLGDSLLHRRSPPLEGRHDGTVRARKAHRGRALFWTGRWGASGSTAGGARARGLLALLVCVSVGCIGEGEMGASDAGHATTGAPQACAFLATDTCERISASHASLVVVLSACPVSYSLHGFYWYLVSAAGLSRKGPLRPF